MARTVCFYGLKKISGMPVQPGACEETRARPQFKNSRNGYLVGGKIGLQIGNTEASDSRKERGCCPAFRFAAVGTGKVAGIEFCQGRITGHWMSKDQAATPTTIAM